MAVESFVKSVEHQIQSREQEKEYHKLLQGLSSTNYDTKQIEYLLETSPSGIMGALCWATEQGELQLENNPGRLVWRHVRQYYHKSGKKDLLDIIDEALYKATASEWRTWGLEIYANFKGVFLSALTLGYAISFPIINATQRRHYKRYVDQRLGSVE